MRKEPGNHRQEEKGARVQLSVIGKGIILSSLLSLLGCIIIGTLMFVSDWTFDRLPALTTDLLVILSLAGGVITAGRRASGVGWFHGGLTGLGFIGVTVLTGYLMIGTVDWRVVLSRAVLGCLVGSVCGVIAVNLD